MEIQSAQVVFKQLFGEEFVKLQPYSRNLKILKISTKFLTAYPVEKVSNTKFSIYSFKFPTSMRWGTALTKDSFYYKLIDWIVKGYPGYCCRRWPRGCIKQKRRYLPMGTGLCWYRKRRVLFKTQKSKQPLQRGCEVGGVWHFSHCLLGERNILHRYRVCMGTRFRWSARPGSSPMPFCS